MQETIASTTDYHAKLFAHELNRRHSVADDEKLAGALLDAQVDLNPHQVEAALFAFKSPLSKGAILADEVGLGKTIEAGLVLAQKWTEGKRRILVIAPANLRKQWSQEVEEKFFLPTGILEARNYNKMAKDGIRYAAPKFVDGALWPCQPDRRLCFWGRKELSCSIRSLDRRSVRRIENEIAACLPSDASPSGAGIYPLHQPHSHHTGVYPDRVRAIALRFGIGISSPPILAGFAFQPARIDDTHHAKTAGVIDLRHCWRARHIGAKARKPTS